MHQKLIVSLVCKQKKKKNQFFFFPLFEFKNILPILGANIFLFLFLFLVSVHWCTVKRKVFAIFPEKFVFLENENFNVHAPHALQNLPIFWNWTQKNITDRQPYVHFQKSKKVVNHSTLLYRRVCKPSRSGLPKVPICNTLNRVSLR